MRTLTLATLVWLSCLSLFGCVEFDEQGYNVTTEFNDSFSRESNPTIPNNETLALFRQATVLTVPGFLSNPSNLKNLEEIHKSDKTFKEMHQWLTIHGIAYRRAITDPKGSVANNGQRIARHIAAIPGDVILVTHSKGSLDSLSALLQFPAVRAKVKGWIAFQAPFYGTPIADLITALPASNALVKLLVNLFSGDAEVVENLSSGERFAYMDENEAEIRTILRAFPLLNIASVIEKQPLGKPDTSLRFSRDILEQMALKNDGLVPWKSSLVPSAHFVKLENWDHYNTVRESSIPADRIPLYRTLFELLAAKR